jgi:broad specificity phosphatase PhoE/SAM-dependent methyltransferase
MKNLYLVRLAETENNVQKIWSGRKTDSPLTLNGISQSHKVAELLSDVGISHIYSSPFARVIETARPLSEILDLTIEVESDFQEIDLGDFDGQHIAEVMKTKEGEQFFKSPRNMIFPGATESLYKSQEKAFTKITELLSKRHQCESFAVFSHGGLMRLLLIKLLGFDDVSMLHKFQIGSCAILHLMQKETHSFELTDIFNFGSSLLPEFKAKIDTTALPEVSNVIVKKQAIQKAVESIVKRNVLQDENPLLVYGVTTESIVHGINKHIGLTTESTKLVSEVMGVYDVVAEIFDDVFRNEEESKKHGQWLNGLLKELGVKRVLDAGAGTGEQAIQLWRSGQFEVVIANDLNAAMLDCCKKKLSGAGIDFTEGWPADTLPPFLGVTQSDWAMLDMKLPEQSFDAIVCLGIAFYHLLTKERFIAALNCWNRLLRPGGYVLFDSTGEHEDVGRRIREGIYKPESWEWTVSELEGRSGKRYAHVHGNECIELKDAPLGWRTFNTFVIAELTPERMASKLRTASSGAAVLDKKAVEELAGLANFKLIELSKPSPFLYVQAQDFLFQKL